MPTNIELAKQVEELKAQLSLLVDTFKPKKVEEIKVEKVEDEVQYPVPSDYRKIVDEVLNKHFGIKCVPQASSPMFEFIIVVPDQYSTASEAQKLSIGGKDIRPLMISNADGINAVRIWAEKVYNTFSTEIKSQIHNDRVVDFI